MFLCTFTYNNIYLELRIKLAFNKLFLSYQYYIAFYIVNIAYYIDINQEDCKYWKLQLLQ